MYEIYYLAEDGGLLEIKVAAVNKEEAMLKGNKELILDGYDINKYTVSKVYRLN